MFCYQCEQTYRGTGCDKLGVCGKNADTAELQDLLIHATKGVAQYAHRARRLGARDKAIDAFVVKALFSTVTNVNFDDDRLTGLLNQAAVMRDQARELYEKAAAAKGQTPETPQGPAQWQPAVNKAGLIAQGREQAIGVREKALGAEAAGLQELICYGLKGAAAYMDHALILGRDDPALLALFHEGLDFLTKPVPSTDELVGWALKAGEVNLNVMALLDAANTETYGHPEPTVVKISPIKGKCIAVSGHDLKDLADLLEQTAGKGIHVYTHGEMLPCLAYPELKKHPHFVGHYGTAWQNQAAEFDAFPGAILMTTNCIQKPKVGYQDRIFTSGLVAWPGVRHIADHDYTPVIEAALAAPGFSEDAPEKTITIGFGHNAVMSVAGKVVEAVKSGAIRHFFLVGGCDGAKPGRNYYTEIASKIPQDCVILTLACGKFRFNTLDFGDIGGIPRLLDIGQCNDAYSAVQIAVALANAFGTDVNSLPLSLILSWYEQKAVAILLSLLHLGIRDIRVGPSLPAFIKPPVLQVLVDKFNIAPISTPEEDLKAILG